MIYVFSCMCICDEPCAFSHQMVLELNWCMKFGLKDKLVVVSSITEVMHITQHFICICLSLLFCFQNQSAKAGVVCSSLVPAFRDQPGFSRLMLVTFTGHVGV